MAKRLHTLILRSERDLMQAKAKAARTGLTLIDDPDGYGIRFFLYCTSAKLAQFRAA